MLGKRSPHHLGPNGLAHRQPMPDFFHGLYGLTDSVLACTTFHEECVSLAEQFNIPVSFRYAIDQRTMQYLVSHQGKPISSIPLRKVDNLQEQLQGADRIVVCLEYQDKRVVYENTTSNADISYTNATYHQVSAGVIAAIYTLLMRELPPKVYLPEELVSTVYADIIFALLPTRRIVTGSMDVDEVIAVRHQATRRKFEGLFQQMV